LPLNDIFRKKGPTVSARVLSLEILAAFIMYLFFILILTWWNFLPQMETASEETRALLEESGSTGAVQIIHGEFIPEIRLAHLISFVCYGLVDGIIFFTLWQSNVAIDRKERVAMMAYTYTTLRTFSAFITVMLTITVLVGTDPSFYLTLLFISIPIFSILSLLYFYYFKNHLSPAEGAGKVIFKIPTKTGP
jgi:hypothetical protein